MRVTGSGIEALLGTLEACPNDGLSHNASMAVVKDLRDAREELRRLRDWKARAVADVLSQLTEKDYPCLHWSFFADIAALLAEAEADDE